MHTRNVLSSALAAFGIAGSAAAQLSIQQTTTLFPVQIEYSNQLTSVDLDGDDKLDIVTVQGEKGNFQNRICINGPSRPADSIAPNFIQIEEVPGVADFAGPFAIRVKIHDSHTSDRGFYPDPITLTYTVDGSPSTIDMDWYGNSSWRGVIPALEVGCGTVEYHVTASDRAGNVSESEPRSFLLGPPPAPTSMATATWTAPILASCWPSAGPMGAQRGPSWGPVGTQRGPSGSPVGQSGRHGRPRL